jgi:predicted nucleic-acid-binding protein
VKVTADTNVLVRLTVQDDASQARAAEAVMNASDLIAIPLTVFCEFVWVLRRSYGVPVSDIADAIRKLLASEKVATHRPAVEAGLAMLEAGGDFADGAIAFEGGMLGGDTFVSFDREAVSALQTLAASARLLT